MKTSRLLALAMFCSSLALAGEQSRSNGLREDSTLSVLNRVHYMNRDFRHGADNRRASESAHPAGYREESGLGVHARFSSGFTQGSVGFGADAFVLAGVKLDSGKGRYGALDMQRGRDGRAEDSFSRAGGALKARLSSSTLSYGEQFVALPVLSTDDSRLLPESVEGLLLSSREIQGLELHAGHFTALTAQNAMRHDGANDGALRALDLLGGRYAISEALSVAYYHSSLELRSAAQHGFHKHYGNARYRLPLGEARTLSLDLDAYQTRHAHRGASDTGNRIWSLAAAYRVAAHTLTLAYQRSSGDTFYAYGVDGGGSIWLANSVQISDFNGEDERSWQLRYDLDMATYGVPGLSVMSRYLRGSDITLRDGRQIVASGVGEHEFDVEARYVIQRGPAKDLSLRLRNAVYRSSDAAHLADANDVRLILEYPLNLL